MPDAHATGTFFDAEKPDHVFLAAAKLGGIVANNSYPAEFIRDKPGDPDQRDPRRAPAGVQRLLFLGSSCSTRSWRRSR